MITRDSIERLKTVIDIVDVVSNYVELKKTGGYFKACCPFHEEKTPSFVVTPARNSYKCFGCGVGGDAIKFVMEYEKLSYPEALEKIATQYNITLQYEKGAQKPLDSRALDQINGFYHKRLAQNPTAMQYLENRGIHTSLIEKFELGYAPDSRDTMQFLSQQFIRPEEALECGITGRNERGTFARFIERIMFPIRNISGKLVGYGGRTISNHPAKYINSPETKLFQKSRLLYGYYVAKADIYKKKEVIITEGYLDVIMLHQAGFTQAVATLGTALTKEHIPLLKKGDPNIVMAYDGDLAGQEAAFKAAKLLASASFKGGVVLFGGGMDPADMVKNHQIEQLNNLLSNPKPFVPFCVDKIVESFNTRIPEEQEQALKQGIAFLRTLNPIQQDNHKKYLASKLRISDNFINTSKFQEERSNPLTRAGISNPLELQIIKTLINNLNYIDMILEYVDKEIFEYHQDEFDLLLSGAYEDEKLLKIHLDNRIIPLDESNLKFQLVQLLSSYYKGMIPKINKSHRIDSDRKRYLINTLWLKIEKLRKGEFVAYESIGAI